MEAMPDEHPDTLQQLLSAVPSQTFQAVFSAFRESFAVSKQFIPLFQLWSLLHTKRELSVSQQLTAYYLLNCCYRDHQPRARPFTYHLVKVTADPKLQGVCRWFAFKVLTDSRHELAQQTPHAVQRQYNDACLTTLPAAAELKDSFLDSEEWSALQAWAAQHAVSLNTAPHAAHDSTVPNGQIKALQQHDSHATSSSAPSSTDILSLKGVFEDALKRPIPSSQQNKLMAALNGDANVLRALGLRVDQLELLVDNNPQVAGKVLLALSGTADFGEYLERLASMAMTLHSMEVVNQLASSVQLPSDFIQMYIFNCITTCENIQDRYHQIRFVRLVCVFVTSLIRSKAVDVHSIRHEVQAFCIPFSHMKEAAGLFRLLKNYDANSGSNSEAGSSAANSPSMPLSNSAGSSPVS